VKNRAGKAEQRKIQECACGEKKKSENTTLKISSGKNVVNNCNVLRI